MTIKAYYVNQKVYLELPGGRYLRFDPDGELYAGPGSESDSIHIYRLRDLSKVVADVEYDQITDQNSNTYGSTRNDVVLALNDKVFSRQFAFPPGTSIKVKNNTALQLQKGFLLYQVGYDTTAEMPLVEAAKANNSSKMPAMFFCKASIPGNSTGEAIVSGLVEDQVTTGPGFAEGVVLYVQGGGGYTPTKPTGSNIVQRIGVVGRSHATAGTIFFLPAPVDEPSIDEVVDDTTPQRGGDLDVNGNKIVSSSDGDIVIEPDGTGTVVLGGDIDVNGNKITSTSDGDVVIDPDGTGSIVLKADDIQFQAAAAAITSGVIRLFESQLLEGNYIALAAPTIVTSDTTLTLPDGDGSQNQALKTDGAGQLGWTNVLDGNDDTLYGITKIKKFEGGQDGQLAFYDQVGDNYVVLRAPVTLTENTVYNLPATEGTNGQVLQTNGSGTLSWTSVASAQMLTLANISGRYYWQSADDDERVYTGNSVYGPFNFYSHSSEPTAVALRDYAGTEVRDTTTAIIGGVHLLQYGIKNPYSGKKVRIDYSFRMYYSGSIAPTVGTPFGFSLWTGNANATGSSASVSVTYRGESDDHDYVNNSNVHHHGSFTTTSNIDDDYLLVFAEHRNASGINGNTFMVANFNVYITD